MRNPAQGRDEFKVGDVVYVVIVGGFGREVHRISGPFTIEKRHKSNGNLIVGKKQFSTSGHDLSTSYSSSTYLAHEGSKELADWRERYARHRVESECIALMRSLSVTDVTTDRLETLLVALRRCKPDSESAAPIDTAARRAGGAAKEPTND